jgi:hypothetical protein
MPRASGDRNCVSARVKVPNMRKSVLSVLCLALVLLSRPGFADPLPVTGGAFLLDIEGDMFTLTGQNFGLTTTKIGNYTDKLFPGRCDPGGWPFGFCNEAEGALVDWGFHTTPGERLLGTGNVALDNMQATDVDFLGSMAIDMIPTPLSSGGTIDFDFVAPFVFNTMIRGVRGGEQLFAQQFTGRGLVRVNYEVTGQPGVFSAADETISYEFANAQTPEPGTLLLVASGIGGGVMRRRRSRQSA